MTNFPGSPLVLRGALVAVDVQSRATTVVPFQFNPHTLTRSIQTRGAESGPGAVDFGGPPTETITVEAEVDAVDDLAASEPNAVRLGVHHRIAALERLAYPRSADAIDALGLADQGAIEILPPAGPLVLFVWGPQRILPVSVRQLSVTEEAFDPSLNPIRAKVSLTLKVLTWQDLPSTHPGHALFLAHHVARETLAALATTGGLDSVLGSSTLRI